MKKITFSLFGKIFLFIIIGGVFLGVGIYYAHLRRGISNNVPTISLESQVVQESDFHQDHTDLPIVSLTVDEIQQKIITLEGEILEETNDPDKALKLRRERQKYINLLPDTMLPNYDHLNTVE